MSDCLHTPFHTWNVFHLMASSRPLCWCLFVSVCCFCLPSPAAAATSCSAIVDASQSLDACDVGPPLRCPTLQQALTAARSACTAIKNSVLDIVVEENDAAVPHACPSATFSLESDAIIRAKSRASFDCKGGSRFLVSYGAQYLNISGLDIRNGMARLDMATGETPQGGAVFMQPPSQGASELILDDCSFSNNFVNATSVSLDEQCPFYGGGAVWLFAMGESLRFTARRCRFTANRVTQEDRGRYGNYQPAYGGAVAIVVWPETGSSSGSFVQLESCTFVSNLLSAPSTYRAVGGAVGIAIFSPSAQWSQSLNGNVFQSNSVSADTVAIGGGMGTHFLTDDVNTTIVVRGGLFAANEAFTTTTSNCASPATLAAGMSTARGGGIGEIHSGVSLKLSSTLSGVAVKENAVHSCMFAYGGGLSIGFFDSVSFASVLIQQSSLTKNTASAPITATGGGVSLDCLESAFVISLTISDSSILQNALGVIGPADETGAGTGSNHAIPPLLQGAGASFSVQAHAKATSVSISNTSLTRNIINVPDSGSDSINNGGQGPNHRGSSSRNQPSSASPLALTRGGGLSVFVQGIKVVNTTVVTPSQQSGNSVNLHNSQFTGNRAQYGGAVSVYYVSIDLPRTTKPNRITVDSCEFLQNTATGSGAALHLQLPLDTPNVECLSDTSSASDLCLLAPSFQKTLVPRLWMRHSDVLLQNSTFTSNWAVCHACSGGAATIVNGAAVIIGSNFSDNQAGSGGGGLSLQGSAQTTLSGTSFRNNSNTAAPNVGGGDVFSDSLGDFVAHSDTTLFPSDETGGLKLHQPSSIDIPSFTMRCDSGSRVITTMATVPQSGVPPWKNPMLTTPWNLGCQSCGPGTFSWQRGQLDGRYDAISADAISGDEASVDVDDNGLGPKYAIQPGFECTQCPESFVCEGGNRIRVKTGYWMEPLVLVQQSTTATGRTRVSSSSSSDQQLPVAFRCPSEVCCTDSACTATNQCAFGRDSSVPLCGSCLPGHSKSTNASCVADDDCNDWWVWLLLIAIVLGWSSYILLAPVKRPAGSPGQHRITFDLGCGGGAQSASGGGIGVGSSGNIGWYIPVLTFFYQILPIALGDSRDAASNLLIGIFSLTPTNINLNDGADEGPATTLCFLRGLTPEGSVALSMLPALLVIGAVVIVMGVCSVGSRLLPALSTFRRRVPIVLARLLLLLYSTLSAGVFNLLHCRSIGPYGMRLLLAGGVKCYEWWQSVVWVALFLFVVPAPLLLWWMRIVFSRRGQRQKHNDATRATNAFSTNSSNDSGNDGDIVIGYNGAEIVIVGQFAPRFNYWSQLTLFYRLTLALCSTFILDTTVRAVVISIAVLCILVVHVHTRPFIDLFANVVNTMALLVLSVVSVFNVRYSGVRMGRLASSLDTTSNQLLTTTAVLVWMPLLAVIAHFLLVNKGLGSIIAVKLHGRVGRLSWRSITNVFMSRKKRASESGTGMMTIATRS